MTNPLYPEIFESGAAGRAAEKTSDLSRRLGALERRAYSGFAFEMYLATTVSSVFANGVFTKVPFDTLAVDFSSGGASLANDNFIVPASGWYGVSACVQPGENLNDGNTSAISIYVNNAEFKRIMTMNQGAANNTAGAGSAFVFLTASTTVDVRYYQASGAAKSAQGGRAATYLHVVRVR